MARVLGDTAGSRFPDYSNRQPGNAERLHLQLLEELQREEDAAADTGGPKARTATRIAWLISRMDPQSLDLQSELDGFGPVLADAGYTDPLAAQADVRALLETRGLSPLLQEA